MVGCYQQHVALFALIATQWQQSFSGYSVVIVGLDCPDPHLIDEMRQYHVMLSLNLVQLYVSWYAYVTIRSF